MTLVLDAISRSVAGEVHSSNISLTLERGTLNVLLGPTLSGKTSLMRLMAGLDKPDSGHLSVDGRDVTGVPVGRRNVAMVYQQFINYPTLSVFENIASPLRVAGLTAAKSTAVCATPPACCGLNRCWTAPPPSSPAASSNVPQ